MSRISSGIPIFALTPTEETGRKVTLYRGVYPVHFQPSLIDDDVLNERAIDILQANGVVSEGDIVILTKGDFEVKGGTDMLKLIRVGKMTKLKVD